MSFDERVAFVSSSGCVQLELADCALSLPLGEEKLVSGDVATPVTDSM